MKLIAVGDNVVDCYLDQGVFYPGGNAVNVAVNAARNGAQRVGYLGIFGNDPAAEHIKASLDAEHVEWDRSRTVMAVSGQPLVRLGEDGDRLFVGSEANTAQHLFRLRLTQDDLGYIAQFDCCHSSCYSGLEPELPRIATCCPVSFDFSDEDPASCIDQVIPHLRFAFFSGSRLDGGSLDGLIRRCHEAGVEVVGITLGSRGALFSKQGVRFHQPIKPAPSLVDTMGAGDSFIAGFLTKYVDTGDMELALDHAAGRAAATCGFHGAFGHPHPFTEAQWKRGLK